MYSQSDDLKRILCYKNSMEEFYEISENAKLGRHLVANKVIKAGEIIISEPPLIYGPSQLTAPVCLGPCGRILDSNSIQCPKCGWPMCGSKECLESSAHQPECWFTTQRGDKISISNFIFPHPNYQCITILRILYQRDHNKNLWENLMRLQSHCEERKGTEKYKNDRINIAEFIRRFFKLENVFSEEEIMKACGILQVNGHEVPLTEPPYVAIYKKCSILEHNCSPNCCKSFNANGSILIHAGREILAGEHLSICYTDSLWGTPDRRHYLAETKFFWCECQRCQDPTEFGTYFSALKCCDKTCSGFLLPKSFVLEEQSSQMWKCSKCSKTMSATAAINTVERVGHDLLAMRKGDASSCKLFLHYYQNLLPPNHFHLTDVQFALSQLIGQQTGALNLITNDDLEIKIDLCRKLLKLIQVLNPAEVRVKGTLLFELHAGVAEKARRRALDGVEPEEWKTLLVCCRELLAEVTVVLQHEPLELPEGQLAAQAAENLQQLDLLLQSTQIT